MKGNNKVWLFLATKNNFFAEKDIINTFVTDFKLWKISVVRKQIHKNKFAYFESSAQILWYFTTGYTRDLQNNLFKIIYSSLFKKRLNLKTILCIFYPSKHFFLYIILTCFFVFWVLNKNLSTSKIDGDIKNAKHDEKPPKQLFISFFFFSFRKKRKMGTKTDQWHNC